MALFKFTKGILKNKKIDVYNNGKMYRDFTYIDDIVDGILKILNTGPLWQKNEDNPIQLVEAKEREIDENRNQDYR